jgi:hypothetical protein
VLGPAADAPVLRFPLRSPRNEPETRKPFRAASASPPTNTTRVGCRRHNSKTHSTLVLHKASVGAGISARAEITVRGRGRRGSNDCAYNFAVMCYFVKHWPAIVQAVSALAVAYLTYRLVLATDLYARITREALGLNTRQYERELLPNWHISFAPAEAGVAWLRIFNLSRSSARVTHLFIRVESENEPESRRFPLDLGMPSAHREITGDIAPCIVETVNPYIVNGDWNGVLEIGVVFLLAGASEPRPSERFQFRVAVRGGQFREAAPKLPYIAGDLGEGEHQ